MSALTSLKRPRRAPSAQDTFGNSSSGHSLSQSGADTRHKHRRRSEHSDTPRSLALSPLGVNVPPPTDVRTRSRYAVTSTSSPYSIPTSNALHSQTQPGQSTDPHVTDYAVVQRSIGTLRALPAGVQALGRDLSKCQLRVGILHEESRESMQPFLDTDIDKQLTERLFSVQRASLGSAPCIADISNIVELANAHQQERASAAAWSSDIHTAMLRTAMYCSKWRESLRCDNAVVASLALGAFALPSHFRDCAESASSIDFSIGLRLSKESTQRFSRHLPSLNPTLYEPLRFAPSAIHMAQVSPREAGGIAHSPLSSWLIQHVSKLRELLDLANEPADLQLPILPVLVTQYHDWTCLLFEDCGDQAQLHSGFYLGSTKNEVDAYALVAGLHVLMNWVQLEYRPWFEETILQPLSATMQLR